MAGKVFLVGAWGYNNFGDDWLCFILKKILDKINISYDVFYPEWHPLHIPFAPRNYSYILFGGGGYLYDLENNLDYYLKFTQYDLPAVVIGLGSQGQFNRIARRKIQKAFKNVSVTVVRDIETKQLLEQTGIPARLTADLAFRSPHIVTPYCKPLNFNLVSEKNSAYLGIAVSRSAPHEIRPYHRNFNKKFEALLPFFEKSDHKLYFISLNDKYDTYFAGVHHRITYDGTIEGTAQIFKAITQLEVAITTRLHFFVTAILCGVPTLCIVEADNPLSRLVKRIEYPLFCKFSDSTGHFRQMFNTLLQNKSTLKQLLHNIKMELVAESMVNLRIIEQLKDY